MEHTQEEALQAELSLVQAEEAALPLKISKLQEALHLEHAELQRREAGPHVSTCYPSTVLSCKPVYTSGCRQEHPRHTPTLA